jgi:hypothetical protein
VIGANLFGKKEFALDDLDSQEAAPAAATQAQKPRKTKIAVALAAGAIGYAIVSAGQVSTDETDLDLAQVTYPTMRCPPTRPSSSAAISSRPRSRTIRRPFPSRKSSTRAA